MSEDMYEIPNPHHQFREGQPIKVTDGPFTNFTGIVALVYPDRYSLKVNLSVHGRPMPVELSYVQVERL